MDHLKPALKTWLDDMKQNQFNFDSRGSVNDLKDRVNGWVSKVDLENVERNRDAFLSSLVGENVRASDRN
jgi:3-hydroxyacyl-CoA dehydrogenase